MGTDQIDEPVTPAGRMFLRPEMEQIIHCVMGFKNPFDIDAVRSEINNSLMIKHPRFSSLLVADRRGRQHWRRTDVDVDRHLLLRDERLSEVHDDDDAVNGYLADLAVSSPLATDKPLWEIHLLTAHNCAVFRVHHALGDGISLMSMLLASCRRASDPDQLPGLKPLSSSSDHRRRRRWESEIWKVLRMVWFTIIYVVEFAMRALWMRDRRTTVSGGEGVELWPRKLATAKFRLEDMKAAKKAIPDATINDVLFGVISSGLSKYLNMRSPKALQDGHQITGVAMVNLRPQPGLQELSDMMKSNSSSRWGNKFGMVLLPIYYYRGGSSNPLEFTKRAKKMLDRKKLSLEALFSYKIGELVMSFLGPKLASVVNYRIVCNTSFTVSNVVGPQEEITLAGNPVTYMRANSSSLPHAITMHMVSYAGRADLQIMVAKDIIPDPHLLANFFEEALLEMKEAALSAAI